MDFLFEWLIQLVFEIVGELLGEAALEATFKGLRNTLASRIGRIILGAAAGFGFGVFWGKHLSGHAHWPRLLWVSIALGAAALIAAARARQPRPRNTWRRSTWNELFAPPWRWDRLRFLGFAAINAGLAGGIALAFTPA